MNNIHTDSIEVLESRIAPAGLVTATYSAISGLLTLDGDVDANEVNVFKTGTNTYRIEGIGTGIDTLANPFRDIKGPLTSIVINALGGGDAFSVSNLVTLKDLTFNGGAGADTFTAANLTTIAGVTADFGADGGAASFGGTTKIGGNLTVTYGAGGGAVTVSGAKATITGGVILNGDAGADSLDFGPASGSVGKGIKFTGGAGLNEVDLHGLSISIGKATTGRAVDFIGGDDGNTLDVGGASIALKGNVFFQGGGGVDALTLHSSTLKIGGLLTANTFGGTDTVTLTPGTGTILGAVSIDLGEGVANAVKFAPTASLALASALTVKGGASSDSFKITSGPSVKIMGPVLLDLGDGATATGNPNSVELSSAVLNLGSSLTITGAPASEVKVKSTATVFNVKGALAMNLGAGDNLVEMFADQASFGSLSVITGDGFNLVQFAGSTLKVGGATTVETGDAFDTVDFNYDTVNIKGATAIRTGADLDTVTFIGDGTVTGDFSIDFGDGESTAMLAGKSGIAGNLKIGGKLTVTSVATDTAPGFDEILDLKELTVGKAILINLGAGDSQLTIDNLIAKDTFTLNTGLGADEVNIEQGSLFGASVFSKLVEINLDAGADTLLLGVSSAAGSSSFARFLAAVVVNGGADTDGSNDFLNVTTNFFAPGVLANPLTGRTNFEGPFI